MQEFPQILGAYTVIRRLASGGMGEVLLAHRSQPSGTDVRSQKKLVVLKCMYPHHQEVPTLVQRFNNEAALGARLHHPNLVRVLDVLTLEHRRTMVMEYVRGATLRTLLDMQAAPVPPIIALEIVRQLADGLQYVHSLTDDAGHALDIVHRDIGPDNILLEADGTVRLIDFGIASYKDTAATTVLNRVLTPGLEAEGLVGTVPYMSPEQCSQLPVDARSDLYAVGTVLWELLRGKSPYPRFNRPRAMLMIVEDAVPPPFEPSHPQGRPVNQIFETLHAHDPADRYQHAQALGDDIAAAQERMIRDEHNALPPREALKRWIVSRELYTR